MNSIVNDIYDSWKNEQVDIVAECDYCEQDVVIPERYFKSRRNSGKGIACEECSGEMLPLNDEVDDWSNNKLYGSIWEDMTNIEERED